MKYIVVPNSINDLPLYKDKNIDTFIIGLKDYSVNYPSLSISEIETLSKEYNLFIAVNKNIFNSELNDLLNKLKELSNMNILGVLYYDLGVLNLVKENNINLDLVWHQTHMVTNYNTCNFYYGQGVRYGYVANEITLDEIIEINNKTKMELLVEVIGYPIVSHSRRSLLTNYLKSVSKDKEDKVYEIEEKDIKLKVKETKDGTSMINGIITNGTKPLFSLIENNISYAVLDMQLIDLDTSLEIVDIYNSILNNNITTEEAITKMNNLIGTNTNFFYKKTIYKVKKGDK